MSDHLGDHAKAINFQAPLQHLPENPDKPRMRLLNRFLILTCVIASSACAPKQEEVVIPKRPPVAITPAEPAKPYLKRIQLNSGSSFGPTTNGYNTTVSLANTAIEQSGTTTNGYRIKYNVQDPNKPR